MDEIQIDIGGVQIFQRFIEGSLNLVGLVEGAPKLSGGISSDENGSRKRSQFTICAHSAYLGRNENILSFDDPLIDFRIDALSNVDFISIHECRINMTIPTIYSVLDCLLAIVGISCSQANDRYFVAVVQSYGRRQSTINTAHTKLK